MMTIRLIYDLIIFGTFVPLSWENISEMIKEACCYRNMSLMIKLCIITIGIFFNLRLLNDLIVLFYRTSSVFTFFAGYIVHLALFTMQEDLKEPLGGELANKKDSSLVGMSNWRLKRFI